MAARYWGFLNGKKRRRTENFMIITSCLQLHVAGAPGPRNAYKGLMSPRCHGRKMTRRRCRPVPSSLIGRNIENYSYRNKQFIINVNISCFGKNYF